MINGVVVLDYSIIFLKDWIVLLLWALKACLNETIWKAEKEKGEKKSCLSGGINKALELKAQKRLETTGFIFYNPSIGFRAKSSFEKINKQINKTLVPIDLKVKVQVHS